MGNLSPLRNRSPRLNFSVNLSEHKTEKEQKKSRGEKTESEKEEKQNLEKGGKEAGEHEKLKIRRTRNKEMDENKLEKGGRSADENSGSQEVKRRRLLRSGSNSQEIADSQQLKRGRSEKRKEKDIAEEEILVKRKAVEIQGSPQTLCDVEKTIRYTSPEKDRGSQGKSLRSKVESCGFERKETEKIETEIFSRLEDERRTLRRGRSTAKVKVENSEEGLVFNSPGSQKSAYSLLLAAENDREQKLETEAKETGDDSIKEETVSQRRSCRQNEKTEMESDVIQGGDAAPQIEKSGSSDISTQEYKQIIPEKDVFISAETEQIVGSPKIPINLRIKKAVVVNDLNDLKVKKPPAKSLAPKIRYVPPKLEKGAKGGKQEESGPRGEFAHFDSLQECIADKLKYQYEYATERNMQRAKHQREQEAKRQANRKPRPEIFLTEEQFYHRQFMSDRFRWLRHRRIEMDLVRLNAELKECMRIGKVDVEKCLDCLEELLDLNPSPLMLTKYPDVMITVAKVMLYEEDECIMRKADKVNDHFQVMFMLPEGFDDVEEVVLRDSNTQQQEFIEDYGYEKMQTDLKWQTMSLEHAKKNMLLLPGHEVHEDDYYEASQEVPVPRARLPRSAKSQVSYKKLLVDDSEGLQVVPEVDIEESEDATDYEESEGDFSDDEDFYL
ncbi:hypothetical protein CAPTEDRAFT_188954 [Capitella teleta]|uniref:Lens epithelium-derived growth factor integrase-binding domain-containing protein n=1 Tax=Capitella teleta TaxID=283909 RepID=R7UAM6_CAPTE|nr:hypothetical protein CAPTEDRAFT_188954 [Capitella teleta]|eukprot:ELU03405.1 hypothetical protein CAPTEDRAFT_188954 [Capitella teleta]